ncbi:MAG: DUF563 domain-containing protein [Selenomonadaceae bacterium]|nr:DUF563 domain-containing protein [Selenomonadaceae bacterium]
MAEDLPKRFYVEDVEAWKNDLAKKKFSDRKLEVKTIEHGIILPMRKAKGTYEGGVCDKDFNFIAGFTRTSPPKKTMGGLKWCCVETGYTVNREEIIQLDEDVIYGGAFIGHFGHFFTEFLCRLWYVVQNPDSKLKVLFIVNNEVCKSWLETFLKFMGIDLARIIYVQKPTQCRSVKVPDQSQYFYNDFTKEHVLPYQAMKLRVTPSKTKKIYLTRANFDATRSNPLGVHCFNEKYFEDFFAKHGFEVIVPEKLSLEEQISLIMGADEIATTLGTLAHWSIFKKPSAKFIMLSRTKNTLLTAQTFILEAFHIDNYYIVDGCRDFMYSNHDIGVCILGSNKHWKEFVTDYFDEQIEEDDDIEYLGDSLDKYVDSWYQRYADQKEKVISSLKDMCRRIVNLERELIKKRPLLTYQTHIDRSGWDSWRSENQISNDVTQQLDIQAIKINFPEHKVYYSVYYNDKEGWSAEILAPEIAGTTGQAKSITGIKIRLDETSAKEFDILYRVHKFNGEWTDWVKNGGELYSNGVKLNAIQIKLENKINRSSLSYQTHVAKDGWGSWIDENQISNDIAQRFDIQAIKINFPEHNVYYSVYYNEKEGWSKEVSNSEMAGTTGKRKPITGLKIRLDEAGTKEFDILYRVHKFDGEWTAWAKNGEELITHEKLNSLQIKLNPKSEESHSSLK